MHALGDLGFSEVAQWLQAHGISRVSVVPYGALALLPLDAARVELRQGTRYLCDAFEINLVPSARLQTEAHRRAAVVDRQSRPEILTVGNPLPLPSGVRSLPFAEAEAQAVAMIATNYGYDPGNITCLTTRTALKERVIRGLDRAWFAQLSVHGLYDADVPRRSKLILSGGQDRPDTERTITLEECLNGVVQLTGLRLLVLSACESSIIDIERAANEMVGLPAGFLQAGAAGVIGSLWAVDDRATYLLMSKFAQLYLDPQRGWSPARALAEAQRWLREEATNRVLATYDPTAPLDIPSGVRSLRYSYATAQEVVHLQAAVAAAADPDALPYADPIYWAAFQVTGC
jgi:CHAT domain-containing protein